jgi:hypothetical protein
MPISEDLLSNQMSGPISDTLVEIWYWLGENNPLSMTKTLPPFFSKVRINFDHP